MFDCHIHTVFSEDSMMTIEDVIAKCKEQAIGAVLTEHMDMDFPGELTFECDVEQYFETYKRYRGEKLLLGIEIGMQPSVAEANRHLITSYPFDFVLASTHVVDGIDLCDEAYYTGKSKEQAYKRYFQAMYANLQQLDLFDTVSHLDYIARYCPYPEPEITYEHYQEEIDAILKFIVGKDKTLEVNTKRFKFPGTLANYRKILQAYKSFGGKYVTIGSDAHQAVTVGAHFEEAFHLIKTIGLEAVYYQDRNRKTL